MLVIFFTFATDSPDYGFLCENVHINSSNNKQQACRMCEWEVESKQAQNAHYSWQQTLTGYVFFII